ncbi:MAG: hypothetical protein R3C97_09475 [Geminicoccaceae bacterium]
MLEPTHAIGEPVIRTARLECREIAGLAITLLASSAPPVDWPKPGSSTESAKGRLVRLSVDQCLDIGEVNHRRQPPAFMPSTRATPGPSSVFAVRGSSICSNGYRRSTTVPLNRTPPDGRSWITCRSST